jgi:hypothetical protein
MSAMANQRIGAAGFRAQDFIALHDGLGETRLREQGARGGEPVRYPALLAASVLAADPVECVLASGLSTVRFPILRASHALRPPRADLPSAIPRHRRLEAPIDLPVRGDLVGDDQKPSRDRRDTRRRAPSSRAPSAARPGTPSRSAWICIRRPFAAAPPSTRSSVT